MFTTTSIREREFSIEAGSVTNAAAWTNGNLQPRSRMKIKGSKLLRENIKGDGRFEPIQPNSIFAEGRPGDQTSPRVW